jgi:multiple sugar transport system substrate-binding protein
MKRMMALLLASGLALTACGGGANQGGNAAKPAEQPPAAASGPQKITVYARSGIYFNTLKAVAPNFTKETNINVDVVEIGRDGYQDKVSTQLIGKNAGVDVVLILSNYMGQFGGGGQLENLDPYFSKGLAPKDWDINNFVPAAAKSVQYKGKSYAVPMDVSTMFLFYRKDLIQNPPQTWDEYLATAKQFTKSINPSSPTEFGSTFQGKRQETQPKEWYQYFWSMGGKFFDDKMEPQLNSEAGVKALSFVVDNYKKDKIYPPDITTYEFAEVQSAFQNGKTAMAIEWNPAYPTISDKAKSPQVADKFGIELVPGVKGADGKVFRTPFMHTWTLAVNSASKQKEAAFKFITWVTSKSHAKDYALSGGIPAVVDVLKDPEVQAKRPEFPMILKSFEIAQVEPDLPEYPQIHQFVSEAITVALAGEKSPKEALDAANQKTRQLLDQRGYYKK